MLLTLSFLVALLLQPGSHRVGAFLLPSAPAPATTSSTSSTSRVLHHYHHPPPTTHLAARKKPTADEAASASSSRGGGGKRQRSIEEVGSATLRLGRVDFPPTPDTQVG